MGYELNRRKFRLSILLSSWLLEKQSNKFSKGRFSPLVFGKDDLEKVYGINERIGVEDYGHIIKFYAQLNMNLDG